jgi:hypothetical protein
MAKRISTKNVGETFHLLLDKNPRMGRREEITATLLRIEGEGDDKRAVFSDEQIGEWEAYRYNGRWAYGSSAEPLRVIE